MCQAHTEKEPNYTNGRRNRVQGLACAGRGRCNPAWGLQGRDYCGHPVNGGSALCKRNKNKTIMKGNVILHLTAI